MISNDEIIEAADIIKNGGVVIFPTETVYGIGVNAFNEESIERLYEIKKRDYKKPISVLVSDINMIKDLTEDISETESKIIKEFMPGPLTLILKKKREIPDILTAKTQTIGIRIPDNEIAKKLIEYAQVPIATTSANISGEEANTEINDLYELFKDKIDCYIDGGKSKIGKASTVVKVENENIIILREGTITKNQILKKIKSK